MAKYRTNAFLEAKLAAIEADLAAALADKLRLSRKVAELEDALRIHQQVPKLSFQALSAQCKKWNAEGLPCKVHMGHIVHAKTGAVLL